jgi:hypothetical protein
MRERRGGSIVVGLILILLGGWFLVSQFYPDLAVWFEIDFSWPLILVGVGLMLLLMGVGLGAPGMAVPAAIVGGIGLMMYWQNATGNWESWAYTWTLIPGFVGVGILLQGLLEGNFRQAFGAGGTMLLISLVLFVVFASFLGGVEILGPYWPVLLILLGLFMLARVFMQSRR